MLTKNKSLAGYLKDITKLETNISSELMMVWVDAQTNVLSAEENKAIRDVVYTK